MAYSLEKHCFTGEDPISVLNFLTMFCDEADPFEMSEDQAPLSLSNFFIGEPKNAFLAVKNTYRGEEGGVTCWKEAVEFLLRSYVSASSIRDSNRFFVDTKHLPKEDELFYNTSLTEAVSLCASVHSAEAKKDLLVDGLQNSTKVIVSRYHDSKIYLKLLEHARAESETYLARFVTTKKPAQDGAKIRHVKKDGEALHADSSLEFRDSGNRSRTGLDATIRGEDILKLLVDVPSSLRTSGLLTSTGDATLRTVGSGNEDPDPALSRRYLSRTPVPRTAYDKGIQRDRSGWVTQPQQPAPRPRPQSEVICYSCYQVNTLTSIDCAVSTGNLKLARDNSQKFKARQK